MNISCVFHHGSELHGLDGGVAS